MSSDLEQGLNVQIERAERHNPFDVIVRPLGYDGPVRFYLLQDGPYGVRVIYARMSNGVNPLEAEIARTERRIDGIELIASIDAQAVEDYLCGRRDALPPLPEISKRATEPKKSAASEVREREPLAGKSSFVATLSDGSEHAIQSTDLERAKYRAYRIARDAGLKVASVAAAPTK